MRVCIYMIICDNIRVCIYMYKYGRIKLIVCLLLYVFYDNL